MQRKKRLPKTKRFVTAGLLASLFTGALVSGTQLGAAAQTAATASAEVGGRVDLETPTFSDPTSITNPLFPISELTQVIQLGDEAGEALRHEITLLSETKVIPWNGQQVETLVSQFVAYGDGRILEVAVDFFAQADDGSVWYFGENVDNYEDGVIVNHDGTWLAGRDGPPGMIMPAQPQVGDVYRPENIPGLVFEEVTVKAVDLTVAGPRGPVPGAILVQERLMDGVLEDKIFAPGYGEFQASVPTEDELVTVAIAVPTDELAGMAPEELRTIWRGARETLGSAEAGRTGQLSEIVERMTTAWDAYPSEVPELFADQMSEALDALVEAADAGEALEVGQAAIDVAHASLDLHLQYREPDAVDGTRLRVWRHQLLLDEAAGDEAAVAGDLAVIEAIEDRI